MNLSKTQILASSDAVKTMVYDGDINIRVIISDILEALMQKINTGKLLRWVYPGVLLNANERSEHLVLRMTSTNTSYTQQKVW